MRSGKTVMMATGESGGFDDLIWSALPGLHTIALSLSHVGGRPYGALYALYSGRKVGHVELELLELLAGHAGVALTNATAFEEVVRQRAHERAVIDGSADGIAVLDDGGLVRQWNPAAHRLTGMSAERGDRRAAAVPAARARASGSPTSCRAAAGSTCCAPSSDDGGREGGRLPRRHRGQGARGGQGPVPRHDQPRAAHADHRGPGVREHAGQPLGQAVRRRPALRGPDDRRAGGSLGRLVEQLLLGARAGRRRSCP